MRRLGMRDRLFGDGRPRIGRKMRWMEEWWRGQIRGCGGTTGVANDAFTAQILHFQCALSN